MAFAVQSISDYRTRCNNCDVACPVDALELHWGVPESASPICTVRDIEPKVPGITNRLTAGCGECVQTCPHDSIRLTGLLGNQSRGKGAIEEQREG